MLLQRNIPACIIRLLLDMYRRNEIVLYGKAVTLNNTRRLLIGFVKVEFYHLYCLLCTWTHCWADSKVAVLIALLVTNILAQCAMPMKSHCRLLLSPHWNPWSKYVKTLAKNVISPSMQVKPFVYTFLGNDVIVKIHPHIWMSKLWHLREVEEISKKLCDFIGRTNCCYSVATLILLTISRIVPRVRNICIYIYDCSFRHLTTRSREVSKPRNSGMYLPIALKIDKHLGNSYLNWVKCKLRSWCTLLG